MQTLKVEAERLRNLLVANDNDLSALKTKFLPLQGELWHDWCAQDKSLTRLTNQNCKNIEEHKSNIEEKKKSIRSRQCNEANKGNDFIALFVQNIQSPHESKRMYFIKWIRQFLDDLFSAKLAQLQLDYHREWSQKFGTGSHSNSDPHTKLDAVIREIEKNTFGIEHIFRELGQIYEATESRTYKICDREALPRMAAELLIQGYPIELMDGDAVYVPVSWIGAFLTEVAQMLGDAKIFVLSILGLQSSGKSTLLNALFGLQFAVSAGRCTRGAFMQLVDVGENMRGRLQFDYVLVVDTEGLRSTELTHSASVNRDNELATFVIGLANLTAINIFGENPADMQDILQISVQAIMRMKQVNLQPSCVFVHQNVGAIDAADKNLKRDETCSGD
jgi:hypothetical protein